MDPNQQYHQYLQSTPAQFQPQQYANGHCGYMRALPAPSNGKLKQYNITVFQTILAAISPKIKWILWM